jgi:muconolactone delta-isomerase
MLFFFKVRVGAKEFSMDELWKRWEEEAEATLGAKAAKIVSLYKVYGQRRVIGILHAESHAELNQTLMAGLAVARYFEWEEILQCVSMRTCKRCERTLGSEKS